MKNVLMVSLNAQDVFIGQLSRRLVNQGYVVWRYYVNDGYLENYATSQIKEFSKVNGSILNRLWTICRNTWTMKRIVGDIDCVHYHYIDSVVSIVHFMLYPFSRKRIIATFWGSDFYKSSFKANLLKSPLLNKANIISFTNHITEKSFGERFSKWKEKTKTVRFGLPPLDEISKVNTEDINTFKQKLGLPLDK